MVERSRVRVPAGPTGEFSFSWSTLCTDTYFCTSSTAVLPQWHADNAGHSVRGGGGTLKLNTMHTTSVSLNEVTL